MRLILFQQPVKLLVIAPLDKLSELAAHKEQFFSRMRVHKQIQKPQLRKLFFIAAPHLIQQRTLSVHHLVMRERQNIIFRKRVHHREGQLIMIALAKQGVALHIV